MADTPKTPRIGFKIMRGAQLSVGLGYLVILDGQHWCYQSEEDIGKPLREVAALPLDPSLLELQSTPDLARVCAFSEPEESA